MRAIAINQYRSVSSGNVLERRQGMFNYRGVIFHGLVDAQFNALYDDPDDSFAKHVGMPGSLAKGLIVPVEKEAVDHDGGNGEESPCPDLC